MINLWADNWVPSILNGHPIPREEVEVDRTRVVALIIDMDHKTWRTDELGALFFESNGAAISRIHVGDSFSSYRLIWPASNNGEYSVKSGYWWVQNVTPSRRIDRPSSSRFVEFAVWTGIWKLQVPPKVKIFVWRCIRGVIATRENLFRMRCVDNPCCPICLVHSESVEHPMLLCQWVQLVWFDGPLYIRINGASITSFDGWLSHLFALQLGSNESKSRFLSQVAFSCWFIWKTRCDVMFNSHTPSPSQTIFNLSSAYKAFAAAKS